MGQPARSGSHRHGDATTIKRGLRGRRARTSHPAPLDPPPPDMFERNLKHLPRLPAGTSSGSARSSACSSPGGSSPRARQGCAKKLGAARSRSASMRSSSAELDQLACERPWRAVIKPSPFDGVPPKGVVLVKPTVRRSAGRGTGRAITLFLPESRKFAPGLFYLCKSSLQ